MKKIFTLLILLFFYHFSFAQDSLSSSQLDEIVISANKTEEKKSDIPQQINIIDAKKIQLYNLQTTADVLQNLGGVFVQKSQMGGGSPIIRGFEANKVLLVVDGVRMNNAIYRSGHLQNIITVDANMLERTEVLFGAGSVIYGTDAIGGVVSMFTKKPILSNSEKVNFQTNTFARYSSANSENTWHADFTIGFKKVALLTSFTHSNFGDLQKGTRGWNDYPNFGNVDFYVQRTDNQDFIVKNENPNVQKFSGYNQTDFMQKVLFKPTAYQTHLLNFQYSTSSDVPRFDRLQIFRNGLPRFAEWFYGRQKRLFASYQFEYTRKNAIFDVLRITPAYQQIEESRHSRFFKNDWRESQVEKLHIYSINFDFFKEMQNHEIRYGLEFVNNDLGSDGTQKNSVTQESKDFISRYPNARYTTAGLFLSHRWEISPNFILSDGLRFSMVDINAQFDTNFFKTNLLEAKQNATSLNWNLGLVYFWKGFRVYANLSTGFRNANIDDLGKTFETNENTLVVPNPQVKPEQIFYREIGLSKNINNLFFVEIQGFYSTLFDALAVKPFKVDGKNQLLFNNILYNTVATVNVNEAYVAGFSANAWLKIGKPFLLKSTITLTKGRDISSNVPLDHIPPMYGQTTLSFVQKKLACDLYVNYNFKKDIADYSPSGEDNQLQATPDGMPAWTTFNVKASYEYKNFHIQGGIENIFDQNYRTFASGISASGRNFMLSLRYKL